MFATAFSHTAFCLFILSGHLRCFTSLDYLSVFSDIAGIKPGMLVLSIQNFGVLSPKTEPLVQVQPRLSHKTHYNNKELPYPESLFPLTPGLM